MKLTNIKLGTYFNVGIGISFFVAALVLIIGEVAPAISLRIPLAAVYAEANRFSWGFSALLIFMCTLLFGFQLWINQRFLLQQICAFRDKALQIATDENKLGEQISVAFGREFQEMADAFNVMSATLRKDREHLEELVRERTVELSGANRRLHEEISERKRIADALHESERRQRTLIANLPGIVYRCKNDQELTMEFISDGCKNLTGYLPLDLVNSARLSYTDLIIPEDRDYVRGTTQAALEEKKPYQLTYRILAAGGEVKWVWDQGVGVWNIAGKLLALEGIITDITERKMIEEELHKAHDELENVNLHLVSRAVNSFLTILGLLAPGCVAAPRLRPC